MAEELEEIQDEQEVNVEVTPANEDVEEVVEEEKDFFSNLAEDLDERVLTSLSSQLISDYKKDKAS